MNKIFTYYVSLILLIACCGNSYAETSTSYDEKPHLSNLDTTQTELISAYGISLEKPKDWIVVDAKQYLSAQKSSNTPSDELKKRMRGFVKAKKVFIAKYPEPYDDLNPHISIYITDMERTISPNFLKIFSKRIVEKKSTKASNVEIKSHSKKVQLNEYDALYSHIQSDFHLGKKAIPADLNIWLITKGTYLILVQSSTRHDEKNGTRAEILGILKSFKLNHQSSSNQ